jgi:hypothetical protein
MEETDLVRTLRALFHCVSTFQWILQNPRKWPIKTVNPLLRCEQKAQFTYRTITRAMSNHTHQCVSQPNKFKNTGQMVACILLFSWYHWMQASSFVPGTSCDGAQWLLLIWSCFVYICCGLQNLMHCNRFCVSSGIGRREPTLTQKHVAWWHCWHVPTFLM